MIRALHALDSLAIRLPNTVVSLALPCLFNCSKHCVGQKVQQCQEENKKEGQDGQEEEAQERESEAQAGQAQERWEVCSIFLN